MVAECKRCGTVVYPKPVDIHPTSLNLPVSSARAAKTVITIRVLATNVICMFSHCIAIITNRVGRHGE